MKSFFYIIILFFCFLDCKKLDNVEDDLESIEFIEQRQFFVDDVSIVDYLTIDYCIDKNGNTVEVSIIPEKTSYKNKNKINSILKHRKSIKYEKNGKMKNDCYQASYEFINKKYKTKKLESNKYGYCKNLHEGIFKYKSIVYPDAIIERTNDIQIEKNGNWTSTYKIEWNTQTKYTLTCIEFSDDKRQYLVGKKIEVEIIDILKNGDYVYKSGLLNRTFNIGVISKIL